MKRLTILSLVIAFLCSSFALPPSGNSSNEIQFQNLTYQQALQKAKKEHKMVFMNVYATWCGPCKYLKATTFKSADVAKAFNNSFVNIDIDAEKGEGPTLAQKYQVRAHPLMLILDENGNVKERILGYKKDQQLLDLVKPYMKK